MTRSPKWNAAVFIIGGVVIAAGAVAGLDRIVVGGPMGLIPRVLLGVGGLVSVGLGIAVAKGKIKSG